MKTFFTLSLHLLITSFLWAQAPQGIPYQAVMRNADGSVMASSAVDLTFMIHDGSATGTVVYQESHTLTSNAQGLVSCVVGNGVISQGNFANINWGSGAKFLQVMLGTTDLGTQQMLSVPYALHSASAANGFSNVSQTGDTLYMSNGTFIIVPGISAANYSTLVLGCTNALACNYNAAATGDDGSCLIQGASCDDVDGNTINDLVSGDCICEGTILFPPLYTMGIGVTDVDGNFYPSIIINGQEWMQKNLAVSKYRNGDPIPTGLDNPTWGATVAGAYCIFNNEPANDLIYGKLYNWYAVNDSRGLCPVGWHIPSDEEWTSLINYCDPNSGGGEYYPNVAGGIMKSITGWMIPNSGASNLSGFTGLPGGARSSNGNSYYDNGYHGFWWSITLNTIGYPYNRKLYFDGQHISRNDNNSKRSGHSVRCVRD